MSERLLGNLSVERIGNTRITNSTIDGIRRAILEGPLDAQTADALNASLITQMVIGFGYGPTSEIIHSSNMSKAMKSARQYTATVDLTELKRIESLEYLSLNCNVGEGLESIEGLPNLKHLELGEPLESRVNFGKLHALRSFAMENCSGLESVFKCTLLEKLSLRNLKAIDLRFLTHLEGLRNLSVSNTFLNSLEGIPNIESINLAYVPKLVSLAPLSNCTNLKVIGLEKCKRIRDISPLENLKNLESLRMDNCGEIESLRPLLKLEKLTNLSFIESTKILDGDIACLLESTSLRFSKYANRKHYNIRCKEWHIKRWPGQIWPHSLAD